MYFDTTYNSTAVVFTNIYTAFLESATKMWAYAKCLPKERQPGTNLLVRTITDLIEMAYGLIKSKGKNKKYKGYKCSLTKEQFVYLAKNAFLSVLRKRQSKYGKVISWLDEGIAQLTADHQTILFPGMKS